MTSRLIVNKNGSLSLPLLLSLFLSLSLSLLSAPRVGMVGLFSSANIEFVACRLLAWSACRALL